MFKTTTSKDFDFRKNSERIGTFTDNFSSRVGSSLRKLLSESLSQSERRDAIKVSYNEYIDSISSTYPYKVGLNVDEFNFIYVGLSVDFINKASYSWTGGVNSPESNVAGEILVKSFTSCIKNYIKSDLTHCLKNTSLSKSNVDFFDDKTVSFNDENDIFISEMIFEFNGIKLNIPLIATSGMIDALNGAADSKPTNYKKKIVDGVKLDVIAELGRCNLTLTELNNLKVGDSLKIIVSDTAELVVKGTNMVLVKGEIGINKKEQRVIKIK